MSTVGAPPNLAPVADERLANIGLTARILRRPEIGALLAAIVVAIFFWTQSSLFLQLDGIANWTDVGRTFVGRTSSFFFIIIYLPTPSRRMDDMECCSIGGRDTEDR